MATIDYKQKIKDYMNSSDVDTLYKSMLNNLFPELAESEDERIRKKLISIVRGMIACHDKPNEERDEKYESWIAWFEKKGKKGTNGNEREIPNSAWSDEDKSRIDNLCHFLELYGNQYYGHLTYCNVRFLGSNPSKKDTLGSRVMSR